MTVDDQRQPRRRQLKSGLICFNSRHSTLPCVVRDISDIGAKLTVTGSVGVPDTFELHVELDGTWVDCGVVWRRGEVVGVKFLSEIKKQAPTRRQTLSFAPALTRPSLRKRA
jgi:hypothetical protein